MRIRTSSYCKNETIDLSNIDFSDASVESIYEFICDILGVQAASPEVLRALLPPPSYRTNIDWHELINYLTTTQYATEMSLEQSTGQQKRSRSCETCETCEACGRNCSCSKKESLPSPWHEDLGKVANVQEPRAGLNVMDESEPSIKATSPKNELSSSPQKNVRFASPLSVSSSPSKKRCTHDPNVLASDNLPTSSPKPSDSAVNSPNPREKQYSRLDISLFDSSADPFQDVCMSGALHSDTPNTVSPKLSIPQARRLQIMSVENDNTVCSDDLNLQTKYMPFRLVSHEEFATTWADTFFKSPNNAINEIADTFFTTPRGIATAKSMSESWVRQLIEENVQALKQDPTLTDEDIAQKRRSFQRSTYFRRVSDHERLRALTWFGGEFHRHDYSCVKYPEYLISYLDIFEEERIGWNYTLVWDFWEEVYRRGRSFWNELGDESDTEDSELEVDTDESERQSQERELFDDTPGQVTGMNVSSTGVGEESKFKA